MSLRIFHIIFVTISIALSLFVTVWGAREYLATRSTGALTLSAAFFVCGVVLVFYAGRAFRKLREL